MKPIFHHKLVNGPYEDPALYVRLLRQRRALIFDIGDIGKLTPGEITKITDIFVTHMHIDHFIGFDTALRALLSRSGPLRVHGPSGITDCVKNKLGGYTWNLIEQYPLEIQVREVEGVDLKSTIFRASEGFRAGQTQTEPFSGVILEEPGLKVNAILLDHGIPSLGYCLHEDYHININKARLASAGLSVGPWLSDLKAAIRRSAADYEEILADGNPTHLGELRHLAMITSGQRVCYVTDTAPSEENIERIVELARDADTLYCESFFLDEDIERAVQRNHLTARMAGMIARNAGVGRLVPIHFSPKYKGRAFSPVEEALAAFGGE